MKRPHRLFIRVGGTSLLWVLLDKPWLAGRLVAKANTEAMNASTSVISYAVWLYYRFTFSYRDVEEMPAYNLYSKT